MLSLFDKRLFALAHRKKRRFVDSNVFCIKNHLNLIGAIKYLMAHHITKTRIPIHCTMKNVAFSKPNVTLKYVYISNLCG